MEILVRSAREAVKNDNYYAALFIALSLPDICGKIEHYTKKSKERYIKWCDDYFINEEFCIFGRSTMKYSNGITSSDIYALRCAMLHEGSTNISGQPAHNLIKKFIFTVCKNNYVNFCGHNGKMNFDVAHFCNDMCDCVTKWLSKNPTKLPIDITVEGKDGSFLLGEGINISIG